MEGVTPAAAMDAEEVRGSSPGGAGAARGALGVTEDPSRPQDSFIQLSLPAGPRDGCPEGTPERVRREIERCQVRPAAAGGVGSGRVGAKTPRDVPRP